LSNAIAPSHPTISQYNELLCQLSRSPSQHDISTSISDHLRHMSPLLFSPFSILIDCCVGCTPISPQYLSEPPFPTASSTTYIITSSDGCCILHDTAVNSYISVITPLEIIYVIVVYAFVGGGLLILSSNGIIIIVL